MTSVPKPVRESLDRLMKGLGRASIDDADAIRERWDEAVDPRLSAAASIIHVTATTIVVETGAALVANELRWSAAELARLVDSSGTRTLEVRLRPSSAR